MNRYAVIAGTKVHTVTVWNGTSAWSPPSGTTAVFLSQGEWCEPGATYSPNSTPRFVAAPRAFVWTAYQFLNRFTDSELLAVRSRSQTDAATWRFLTFATAAQEINSDDPVTVAGMDYLVSIGILTPARRAEILSGN